MRIAKCLIIVVLLAAITAGASQELSNTIDASCIVRITADPGIVPLTPQTVSHLVLSSSVAEKAAREVLGLDAIHIHQNILIEWLSQSIRPIGQGSTPDKPRSTGKSRDQGYDQMMQQLAEIYGDRYLQAIPAPSPETETPVNPPGEPTDDSRRSQSSRVDGRRRSGRSTSSPSDAPGIAMGGVVGGMGRGMSGYGGGMMGGMGGGMGGGVMGGMGMGGMYGGSAPQAPRASVEQNAMLKLSVQLPDDITPAAEEFLKALVDNLRKALWNAYEGQAEELKALADFAESRREDTASDLDMAMGIHSPDRMRIQHQLDTIADLSMLSPEMAFSKAIDELKNAVEPPLPIVVMWKELLDSCDIEPTTPIDMDGLSNVKVGTALKLLVEAVSGGFADISYQIDDGVVVIREEEQQRPQPTFSAMGNEVDIRDLTMHRRELARQLERLNMDLATMAARERAIHVQMDRGRGETQNKLAEDMVTRELQELITMSSDLLGTLQRQVEAGRSSLADLTKARGDLTQAKIELARRREELSKSSGGSRLAELNKDLSVMAIDKAEMTAQLQIVQKQLDETHQELAQISRFDPRAARIRIAQEVLDIAERRLIELKTRLANLQPPSVTMIGAN